MYKIIIKYSNSKHRKEDSLKKYNKKHIRENAYILFQRKYMRTQEHVINKTTLYNNKCQDEHITFMIKITTMIIIDKLDILLFTLEKHLVKINL